MNNEPFAQNSSQIESHLAGLWHEYDETSATQVDTNEQEIAVAQRMRELRTKINYHNRLIAALELQGMVAGKIHSYVEVKTEN